MKKKKEKTYKTFNFPNKLTTFEQYHYYLVEFEAIPKKLPPEIVKKIFIAVTKDFLEGFINFGTYGFTVSNLYYNYVVTEIGFDKTMEILMEEIDQIMDSSEVYDNFDEKEAINKLKDKLESFLNKV